MPKRIPLPCTPDNCGDLYAKCGKYTTYDRLCRCDSCTAARREYDRSRAEKRKEQKAQYYAENREARREYRRKYVADNREAVLEAKRQFYYRNREAIKENFRRRYAENREAAVEYARRYRSENHDEVQEAKRRHYEDNREVYAERHRRYRQANPEKIATKNRRYRANQRGVVTVDFTAEQLEQRLSYYGRCYLGLKGCTGGVDHVDHVKPISKGGAHMLCNLRPACENCNLRKKDKWPFKAA